MTSWHFRPSVLQRDDYSSLSVPEIIDHYVQDNHRAAKEGVTVPPPRSASASSATPRPRPLRTLQWNIQAFTSPTKERGPQVTGGMLETIRSARADVVVLNEYHWCNEGWNPSHALLEAALREWGYSYYLIGSVLTPTLVATSWPVADAQELVLSMERSALCLKVVYDDDLDVDDGPTRKRSVWIVGTHLDAFCGDQRQKEMVSLLEGLEALTAGDDGENDAPMILMGDFNQQRLHDYSPDEWRRIAESMDQRKVCRDDGVGSLLQRHGMDCVFDQVRRSKQRWDWPPQTGEGVRCNWATSEPPSTHWTGTAIDYCYSRNVPAHGIYISPAGCSDHRMTVCDWNLPTGRNIGIDNQREQELSIPHVVGAPLTSIHGLAGLADAVTFTATSTAATRVAVLVEEDDDQIHEDSCSSSGSSSSYASETSATL